MSNQWSTDGILANAMRAKYLPAMKNNLYKKMPVLNILQAKGRVQEMTSTSLLWTIVIQRNQAGGLFYGVSPIATTPNNPTVNASLSPSFYYETIALPYTDILQNVGKQGAEKLFSILETQVKNAESTLRENIAVDIYGAGTARGGLNPITGLASIVSASATYAGVTVAQAPTWAAQTDTVSYTDSQLQDQTSAGYLPNLMRNMYVNCDFDDAPDVVVSCPALFVIYENIMGGLIRTNDEMANLGFRAVNFDPASSMIYDKYATLKTMWFLTTSNFSFFTYPNSDFDLLEKNGQVWQWAPNQLAQQAQVIFAGQLRCDVRRQQGLLSNKGS